MRASTSASTAVASTSRAGACTSRARRIAGAVTRRDGRVVRPAVPHTWRGRAACALNSRATGCGGEGDADEPRRDEIDTPSEWREGSEPASPFAVEGERPPLSEDGDDPEALAASPFCSISFIDESVDDGEGAFDAPMDARWTRDGSETEALDPPGAPVAAWPPWLAEEVAATVDEAEKARASRDENETDDDDESSFPAPPNERCEPVRPAVVVESALVEVCAGKACSKKGSAEIHAAIAGAAPETWRCEQRRKCWGLCQAACVVRVTKGTAQTTHVRVTPETAIATVVTPDRPLGYVPRSNFVYERPREGEEVDASADRKARVAAAGPSLPWKPPAGAGLMAAAAAAVEKGVVDPVAVVGGEESGGVSGADAKDRRVANARRPGLTRARRASKRAGTVFRDAAEYVFESKPER